MTASFMTLAPQAVSLRERRDDTGRVERSENHGMGYGFLELPALKRRALDAAA
jgi:hypothetical protein